MAAEASPAVAEVVPAVVAPKTPEMQAGKTVRAEDTPMKAADNEQAGLLHESRSAVLPLFDLVQGYKIPPPPTTPPHPTPMVIITQDGGHSSQGCPQQAGTSA